MRVAALYDIHGNLPALEAVLAEVDGLGVDAIVCGGDVLWGPYPGECFDLLRGRGARFIRGNTERLVLARVDETHAWAFERVTPEQRAEAEKWPETLTLDVDGVRYLFCHGSPRSDEEILTAATPDAAVSEALRGVDAEVVVCGHTHHQFDRVVDGKRLVNAGSVGLPYEGRAGAYWLLVTPRVDLRRTEYDVGPAADRLRATGLPDLEEYLRASLLEPVPREEAIQHFEQMAGRGA